MIECKKIQKHHQCQKTVCINKILHVCCVYYDKLVSKARKKSTHTDTEIHITYMLNVAVSKK